MIGWDSFIPSAQKLRSERQSKLKNTTRPRKAGASVRPLGLVHRCLSRAQTSSFPSDSGSCVLSDVFGRRRAARETRMQISEVTRPIGGQRVVNISFEEVVGR